jgi:hypothetical protein
MRRALALGCAAALLFSGVAAADTVFNVQQRVLTATNEDATVRNNMTVTQNGNVVQFSDEGDAFGMNGATPTPCNPSRSNSQGYATRYDCDVSQIDGIAIDIGPAEDKVTATISKPLSLAGNKGADELRTGAPDDFITGDEGNDIVDGGAGNDEIQGNDGDDTLTGGPGNDKINGGTAGDTIDAGPGDDTITTNDGTKDTVTCGDGNDKVVADTVDEVKPDCEDVARNAVAGSTDEPIGNDKRRPRCEAGGLTSQRVSARRRSLYIAATSNERGEIQASGFLDVGGLNVPLKAKPKPVKVAGGGVELVVRLSRSTMRSVLRDLRRGRRVTARVNVVATDRAGNTSRPVRLRITLRR